MKYLVCLLLAFIDWDASWAQQATRPQGDSSFQVWLTSSDTNKVKVYNTYEWASKNSFDTVYVKSVNFNKFIPSPDSDTLYYSGTMYYQGRWYGDMIADTMRTGYAEWSDSAFRKWWNGLFGEDNPKVYNDNQRLTLVPDSGHGTLVKGDISAFHQFCEFGKEGEDWLRISPTLYSLCNRGRWSLYRYEAEKSVDEDALWNLNPDVPKYDTIGPMWRLISDTAAGHWNPASAMQVYEVRKADPYFTFKTKPGEKKTLYLDWKHYAWLNSNKKPLKLAVWRAEVDK